MLASWMILARFCEGVICEGRDMPGDVCEGVGSSLSKSTLFLPSLPYYHHPLTYHPFDLVSQDQLSRNLLSRDQLIGFLGATELSELSNMRCMVCEGGVGGM